MKRVVALFIIFSTTSAHAQDYSSLLMQMAACETDAQCKIVETACDGWTAINQNNDTAYGLLLNERRSKIECDGKKLPKPAAAECVNNFCEIKN